MEKNDFHMYVPKKHFECSFVVLAVVYVKEEKDDEGSKADG